MAEPDAPSPKPFVVGVNRSGTTLLRMMLDSHPELTIPPETHFVPDLIDVCRADDVTVKRIVTTITGVREWEDFGLTGDELTAALDRLDRLEAGSVLRCFYSLCAARAGKARAGDKTPAYGRSMTTIAAALPETRFVHVIRDGRDVALSIRDHSVVERPVGRIAGRWRRRIENARRQAEQLGSHYLEVRYEELVCKPEPALRRVCRFLELAWEPAVLDYPARSGHRLEEMNRGLPAQGPRPSLSAQRRMRTHARVLQPPDPRRAGRWRREMNPEERREFESVAGELLAELGYES